MAGHCGKCGKSCRYVETHYGATWVHDDTGSFRSNVPEPHDCNTYIQRGE